MNAERVLASLEESVEPSEIDGLRPPEGASGGEHQHLSGIAAGNFEW